MIRSEGGFRHCCQGTPWLALRAAGIGIALLLVVIGFFVVAIMLHPAVAAVAPIALLGGVVILARPFVGVLAMVLFVQMDAVLDKLMMGLPGMKLLALGTLVGLVIAHKQERRNNGNKHLDPPLLLILLFMCWIIISAFFADEKAAVIEDLSRLVPLFFLFYFIIRLADTPEKIKLLIGAILFSTVVSASVTILDSITGQPLFSTHAAATSSEWDGISRSAGATNYDPTTAAAMLLAGVTQAGVIFFLGTGKLRWLGLFGGLIGSAGIVFSLARSAALGLAIIASWLLLRFRRHKIAATALLMSPVILVVGLQIAPDYYVERLLTLFGGGSGDYTLDRRMTYHIVGFDLLIDHPIFGIGLGNFPFYYMDFEYRWLEGRTFTPRLLHNMYLSVLVETGVIGGAIFLVLIGTVLIPTLRRHAEECPSSLRAYREATLAATVVLLFMALTLPMLFNKYVWVLLGLNVAIEKLCHPAND